MLWIQKRLLFPANDGGKVRTLNIVRHVAGWHDVTYLCNEQPGDSAYVRPMVDLGLRLVTVPWRETRRNTPGFYRDLALNLLSPYPFNVAKDYDSKLRQRAVELLQRTPFDLIVCDFVQMARNVIGLSGPPRLLFQHNVEAEIFQRHATTGPGRLRRRYMAIQHRKMRRFEAAAGRHFDAVVAVSDRDREKFEREYGWRHVRTIDTAVDTEYYSPADSAEVPDRILFVGSMDWLPNADGVAWFAREVWPRIQVARPDATFHIVGRNPGPAIRRLAGRNGVEVFANVLDTRPHLRESCVVVVPLLIGGGTRLKICEAISMEKAVVSTPLGAEGLKLTPGEHIRLADDPQTFACSVIELLEDDARRGQMARTARLHMMANFSGELVARQFEQICLKTATNYDAGCPHPDAVLNGVE